MKTLMRNGRDRRSENPFLGHAKKERVVLFGTDQRITSGPAARRPHSKAEYMTSPERFRDSPIPLATRAPSIHAPTRPFAGLSCCDAHPSLSRPADVVGFSYSTRRGTSRRGTCSGESSSHWSVAPRVLGRSQ